MTKPNLGRMFEVPTLITIILVVLSFVVNYGKAQSIQEEMVRRMEKVEAKSDKIDIIQNDVKWIKDFIQKKYGAP